MQPRARLLRACAFAWLAAGACTSATPPKGGAATDGGGDSSDGGPGPTDGGGAIADGGQPADGGPADAGLPLSLGCDVASQDCGVDGGSCLWTSATPDGGLGTACFAGACDVVKQDCPQGRQCTYVLNGTVASRACVAEGQKDAGESCSPGTLAQSCMTGLVCVGSQGGADPRCVRYCYRDADCPSGDACLGTISIAGTLEVPLYCRPPYAKCDLAAQNCQVQGEGCYPSTVGNVCLPAGSGAVGQPCNGLIPNECVRAALCGRPPSATQDTCLAICANPGHSCGGPSDAGLCNPLLGIPDAGACF